MNLYQRARLLAMDVLPPFVTRGISRHLIAPLNRSAPGLPVTRVSTADQLEQQIARADAAARISDDELRKVFLTFEYEIDLRTIPGDPYSAEYHEYQMRLYRTISGRSIYSALENEQTPFDLEAALQAPFPYGTLSGTTTGDQLMMQGFMLRCMNLKPGGRVLEFGPGWGNTTLHMAQLGYAVTAVDVFQGFSDLIARRAQQLNLSIQTVTSDMLDFKTSSTFDAVVFFESFHHCSDHLKMLEHLRDWVTPDGVLVFAGEPINTYSRYPWGVRLDGISLWSMRKFGWLELGFTPHYFLDTLKRYGWQAKMHHSHDVPNMNVVIARKAKLPL
jgi:2-polyprenyl-3-methyl-5-hydroxy-6-metoxy-1,4-benzoquinol methylase